MNPRFATPADADLVSSICSHPEVRRWTAPTGAPPFDPSPWLHPNNMIVLVEKGCFLSNWLGDTTFGVHTNILRGGRGRAGIENARLALILAFTSSNAESFLTKVPENNRAAGWFTKAMGFRWMFEQVGKWEGKWNIDHYRLDIDEWILRGDLLGVGQAFHVELEAAGHASHEPDYSHDCYIGALCAMVAGGKVEKGIKIYNRWARSAGYVPLTLASKSPLLIDARDFLVGVVDGELEIKLKEKEYA